MAGERQDHTLQTSALVNEAYLKLVDIRQNALEKPGAFFAMSAQLMRRILVDFARRRLYLKRGGWCNSRPGGWRVGRSGW
jgi:ECF sigma factor